MRNNSHRAYRLHKPAGNVIQLLTLLLLLASCSNTKFLAEGEVLYTGSKIDIKSDQPIPDKRKLASALDEALYPEPNSKFLGVLKLRLWFYSIAGKTKKDKGFRHWLKYKMGEPPVLLDQVDQDKVSKLIRSNAFNKGHFKSMVSHRSEIKKNKAGVRYTVEVEQPYRIEKVIWMKDTSYMMQKIIQTTDETLLQEGEIYDLDLLENERARIRKEMLNMGFYYFSPSQLFFQADTSKQGKNVALYVKVKNEQPEEAQIPFKINDIYVFPEYSLEDSLSTSTSDTLLVDNMHFISRKRRIRPDEIANVIYLKKHGFYNRDDHEKSISRLMGLNAFKYVNIRFADKNLTDSTGWLNMYVYLTPEKVNSFRAEIKGIAKSNNFAGPGLELSYINRNTFRGAEMLTIATHGNWETQIGGGENLNSWELGINTRLQYPRLETPFNISKSDQKYVPTTFIDLGYNFNHRVQYYTAHSLNAGFGYSWKNVNTRRNEFTLLGIEYYRLGETTPLFDDILAQNPYLAGTYRDQFMIGPAYTYTYNDQVLNYLKNNLYFKGRVDMSGVIVNGIMQGIDYFQKGDQQTDTLLGTLYAQYIRIDGDVRYYQHFKRERKLVFRLFAGTGFPFDRSRSLPYARQYFSGGTNGLRAFRARDVGPGSYAPSDSTSAFFEQTGDIKLEANIEYRFGIQGPVKGAIFLDAGNIWLKNDFKERPGAAFDFNRFYKEIAVGTGLGLRFDFSIVILRLDLGIPLRKPWLPEGERWVADKLFSYKGWSKDNLVLNIAIGYPF
ncbi:MAG: BamA/TamA family outer membrane protein [Bacteroidetes bacterium]|nr:BamA/TamA family outer membrane protein [Bacteroidota bacterium]